MSIQARAQSSGEVCVKFLLAYTQVLTRWSLVGIFSRVLILVFRGYQVGISPLLGKRCRFYPSCSSYGILCFQQFSFFKALTMLIVRLVKCNPWHPGGVDIPTSGGKVAYQSSYNADQLDMVKQPSTSDL